MLNIRTLDFDRQNHKASFNLEVLLNDVRWWGANPFTEPVKVAGVVTKTNNGEYTLDYTAAYSYHLSCSRCLDRVGKEENLTIKHRLKIQLDDISEDGENERVFFVVKGKLDISSVVLSDILLNLPSHILCKEDCRGICPICGCNLNQGNCDCKADTIIDSRFDKIRELLGDGN